MSNYVVTEILRQKIYGQKFSVCFYIAFIKGSGKNLLQDIAIL